ncbi:MAG: T9SS type A sorting domain-containing protein [Vicingus serpentipes]|nr:T9SS type A sorting domain-containing protein [Vicingus serpentipes]
MKIKLLIFLIAIFSSPLLKAQCAACSACDSTLTGTYNGNVTWSGSGYYCIAVGAVINGNVTKTGSGGLCNNGTINGNVDFDGNLFTNTATGYIYGDFDVAGDVCNEGYIQTGALIQTGGNPIINYGIMDLTGNVTSTGSGGITSYCGFEISGNYTTSGSGDKIMTGQVTIGGDLIKSGSGKLEMTGNLIVENDLIVTGSGGIEIIDGGLYVTRDLVCEDLTASGGDGVYVGRHFTGTGTVNVSEIFDVGGNVDLSGKGTGTVTVSGYGFIVGGNMTTGGSGMVTVDTLLDVGGDLNTASPMTVNGYVTVGGDFNPDDDFDLDGSMVVIGNTDVDGLLTLDNGAYFETNNLIVSAKDLDGPTSGTKAEVQINGTGSTPGTKDFQNRLDVCGSCPGCTSNGAVVFTTNCPNTNLTVLTPTAPSFVPAPENNCTPGISLPIELLAFEAKPINQDVGLYWITATEINNDYFTIERSQDAINWEKVLNVNGAGNSNQTITYNGLDKNPYSGTSYYRLKQTDFDGKFAYSHIVAVNFTVAKGGISIYPNPAKNSFEFVYSENANELILEIRDVQGRIVLEESYINLEKNISVKVDASQLATGVYNVLFRSEKDIVNQKLILK